MNKQEQVLDTLATLSSVERGEITPDKDLAGHLGIDSAKALRLLVELEEKLGIEISDEDAARMDTVGDVLNYVEGLG